MIHRKIFGIILDGKPAGDLDRLITVFSEENGVTAIIAKGVKKITSHRGFHLDLFNLAYFEIEEGGSQHNPRQYLREVTTEKNFLKLKNHPENFSAACVIASFLIRALPQRSPQKQLFHLTQKIFEALNDTREPHEVLSLFFLKSLRLLGHLPSILKKRELKSMLQQTLLQLDPEFTLNARRTLGIFSKFERTRSS